MGGPEELELVATVGPLRPNRIRDPYARRLHSVSSVEPPLNAVLTDWCEYEVWEAELLVYVAYPVAVAAPAPPLAALARPL